MASIANRLGQLERQPSRAAWWCEKLALFALPFLVMVVAGHKIGAIDTLPAFWMLGLGFSILIIALVAGGIAFYELWTFGHQGGLRATRGTTLALVMLVPFLYVVFMAYARPQLYDISTDLIQPPDFQNALEDRTAAMNPVSDPSETQQQQQLLAYPRVSARRYPLGSGRVFRAAVDIITDRGWTILTTDSEPGNAPIDEEGSALVSKPATTEDGLPLTIPLPDFRPRPQAVRPNATGPAFETEQVSPVDRQAGESGEEQDERYIEAVATSFIFGFESDVVIRLIEEEEGTLVDMRSVSRFGPHDLGANAARVIGFMQELDETLQGLNQGR